MAAPHDPHIVGVLGAVERDPQGAGAPSAASRAFACEFSTRSLTSTKPDPVRRARGPQSTSFDSRIASRLSISTSPGQRTGQRQRRNRLLGRRPRGGVASRIHRRRRLGIEERQAHPETHRAVDDHRVARTRAHAETQSGARTHDVEAISSPTMPVVRLTESNSSSIGSVDDDVLQNTDGTVPKVTQPKTWDENADLPCTPRKILIRRD